MNWHNFRQSWKEKIISHSCTKIGIANLQISKYFDPQLWPDFRIIYYLANSRSQFKFNAVIDLIIFIVRTGIFGVTLILLFILFLLIEILLQQNELIFIHAHIFKLLFFKYNVHYKNRMVVMYIV